MHTYYTYDAYFTYYMEVYLPASLLACLSVAQWCIACQVDTVRRLCILIILTIFTLLTIWDFASRIH